MHVGSYLLSLTSLVFTLCTVTCLAYGDGLSAALWSTFNLIAISSIVVTETLWNFDGT